MAWESREGEEFAENDIPKFMVGKEGKEVGEDIEALIAPIIPSFKLFIGADNCILNYCGKYIEYV